MTQPFDPGPLDPSGIQPPPGFFPPPRELPPPPRRWFSWAVVLAVLAWVVIAASVTFLAMREQGGNETPAAAAAKDSLELAMMRFQARYLLGIRQLMSFSSGDTGQIAAQVKSLNKGPVDNRLRHAVLAGEIEGPGAALAALNHLDHLIAANRMPLTAEREFQRDALRRLYTDYHHLRYDAPAVNEADRQKLRDTLGWFGDLALAPAGQPGMRDQVAATAGAAAAADIHDACPDPESRETILRSAFWAVIITLTVAGFALMFLFLGFCGLVTLGILWFRGKLRGGLLCGLSPAGVYAETFALWLVLFPALSLGIIQLPIDIDRLTAGGLAMLLSLMALGWPVLRGLSWRHVREDIGWTLGRRPLAEPAIGVGSYILDFPLLLTGVLIVLGLMALQQMLQGGPPPDELLAPSNPNPAHPIVGPLTRGDWELRLKIFVLASLIAPLVEETMFRGVLYRHLRELTRRFGGGLSVVCSGLFSSFIFAVIHPQGLLAVPALMALAMGFVLIREWRVTLIPAMVAHGLNNGLVLLLSVGMLGE